MFCLTVLLVMIVYRQLKYTVKIRPGFDKRRCEYTCWKYMANLEKNSLRRQWRWRVNYKLFLTTMM